MSIKALLTTVLFGLTIALTACNKNQETSAPGAPVSETAAPALEVVPAPVAEPAPAPAAQ